MKFSSLCHLCPLEILPYHLLLEVIDYVVSAKAIDDATVESLKLTSKYFNSLMKSGDVWRNIPLVNNDGVLNHNAIDRSPNSIPRRGTEGVCMKFFCKSKQEYVALRIPRIERDKVPSPFYVLRELDVLKTISHPSICPLYAVSMIESSIYFIFPFVSMNIQEIVYPFMETRGFAKFSLQERTVWNIIRQVCEGAGHLHDRNIIHRNIKLFHILMIPQPSKRHLCENRNLIEQNMDCILQDCTVQLADFSLSCRISPLCLPQSAVDRHVVSLWNRPPEVILGEYISLPSIDVWAIGSMFGELLCGNSLFASNSEIGVLFKIFRMLGVPNNELWPHVSDLFYFDAAIYPDWHENLLTTQRLQCSQFSVDCLDRMLRLNPTDRCRADEISALLRNALDLPELACSDMDLSSRCRRRRDSAIEMFGADVFSGYLENLLDLEKRFQEEFIAMQRCFEEASHHCHDLNKLMTCLVSQCELYFSYGNDMDDFEGLIESIIVNMLLYCFRKEKCISACCDGHLQILHLESRGTFFHDRSAMMVHVNLRAIVSVIYSLIVRLEVKDFRAFGDPYCFEDSLITQYGASIECDILRHLDFQLRPPIVFYVISYFTSHVFPVSLAHSVRVACKELNMTRLLRSWSSLIQFSFSCSILGLSCILYSMTGLVSAGIISYEDYRLWSDRLIRFTCASRMSVAERTDFLRAAALWRDIHILIHDVIDTTTQFWKRITPFYLELPHSI